MSASIKDLLNKIKKRDKDTHKGDFGHVFVLAGSKGLTGAAALTTQAAMRAGAGLVTLGIPEGLNQIMEEKLTEIMTLPLSQVEENCALDISAYTKIEQFVEKCDVMAIGPGLSTQKETKELVRKVVKDIRKDMVIDADGLNAFQEYNDTNIFKEHKDGKIVLTPHLAEMARLIKEPLDVVKENKEQMALRFAREFNVIVVLKGHKTIVASPENEIYENTTGNPGMATAGSGDVLTGIIAAFFGQGLEAFEAAVLGVFVHGAIGDKVAKQKGEVSLIASDLIDGLNISSL